MWHGRRRCWQTKQQLSNRADQCATGSGASRMVSGRALTFSPDRLRSLTATTSIEPWLYCLANVDRFAWSWLFGNEERA